MRTTLDIDEDVLLAAKKLANLRKTTAGKVLSELARSALREDSSKACTVRNGFELLPAGGKTVTPQLVDELLDDDA